MVRLRVMVRVRERGGGGGFCGSLTVLCLRIAFIINIFHHNLIWFSE